MRKATVRGLEIAKGGCPLVPSTLYLKMSNKDDHRFVTGSRETLERKQRRGELDFLLGLTINQAREQASTKRWRAVTVVG